MSKISDGFNALIARMHQLYPQAEGWNRLPNPYKPEENNDLFLRQGWGVAIGPADNSQLTINCGYSVERRMTITLCRLFEGAENDDVGKAAVELQLFEDQAKLINDLEQDISVNGSTMYTTYVADGGLEYVRGETDRFLMVRMDFSLQYQEKFT